MRQITKTLYTIDELPEPAKRQAFSAVSERYAEDFVDFYSVEFLDSAKAFAERFGMEVTDWSLDLYGPSHVTVSPGGYFHLSNGERNALVTGLNESYLDESHGTCSLTGVYTDCFFFDYFVKNGKTSYNTLHKDVLAAVEFAVNAWMHDERTNVSDKEVLTGLANTREIEFYEDGTVYEG